MADSEKIMENGDEVITDTNKVSERLKDPEDEEALETGRGIDIISVNRTDEINIIIAKFEELLLQIESLIPDDQKKVGIQEYIDSIKKVHRLVPDQVIFKDCQFLDILKKDVKYQKLLVDSKIREEAHLLEIQKLKLQFDLETTNLRSTQKTQANDFRKKIFEKNQMRQKLLADLKNQDETHFHEIENLKEQFNTEITKLRVIHNIESVDNLKDLLLKDLEHQNLLADLKNQQKNHSYLVQGLVDEFKIKLKKEMERHSQQHECSVFCPQHCGEKKLLSGQKLERRRFSS